MEHMPKLCWGTSEDRVTVVCMRNDVFLSYYQIILTIALRIFTLERSFCIRRDYCYQPLMVGS